MHSFRKDCKLCAYFVKCLQAIFTFCKVCKVFAPVQSFAIIFAQYLKSLQTFLKVPNFRKNSPSPPGQPHLWLDGGLQPPEPPGVAGAPFPSAPHPPPATSPPLGASRGGEPRQEVAPHNAPFPAPPSQGPFVCAPAGSGAPPRPLTCGGGHCEPEEEPQPRLHEPRSGTGPGARTPAAEKGRWARYSGLALQLRGPRPALDRCVPGPAGSWRRRSHT